MASYKNGSITLENVYGKKTYETTIAECGSSTELQELTITQNGTYTAPEGTAYSPVNVNVPQSGGTLKDFFDKTKSAKGFFTGQADSFTHSIFYDATNEDFSLLLNYNDTENVNDFNSMFCYCNGITSAPNIDTSNATNMISMFKSCKNLVDVSQLNIIGNAAKAGMFNECNKLTTLPKTINNRYDIDIDYMFNECILLERVDIYCLNSQFTDYNRQIFGYCHSLKKLIIRNMDHGIPPIYENAFSGCYHLYGTTDSTYNPDGLKDGIIYVPDDKVEELKTATNWSIFADNIFPLSLLGKPYIFNINSKSNNYLTNKSSLFSILLLDFINTPEVIITSSNEQVATISNIVITTKIITFKANYLSSGVATITVQITGDTSATKTIDVNVVEGMQCRVEQISEVTYGFTLNSNEYYESTNKGKGSSYSLCKLVFVATEKNNILKLECINSGENNFDFGILSNIDTTLSLSSNTDSANVYKSFSNQSSTKPVIITYPEATVGEHFIYIKYKKDGNGDNGIDSLQFKVIS